MMFRRSNLLRFLALAGATLALPLLSGCLSTSPKLGGSSDMTVTGAAGGASSEGGNSQLERCSEPLGTVAVDEDQDAPWWYTYRSHYPQLGTTTPVLRMMIQQSNCFVVVERGRSMNNLMNERALDRSGETRAGSNFGKGQIVAADYTMSPSIQFSQQGTGGVGAAIGGLFGSGGRALGALAGGVSSNEAATTLLLIDNRSSVQISSSVGSAKNFDFKLFGGLSVAAWPGAPADLPTHPKARC